VLSAILVTFRQRYDPSRCWTRFVPLGSYHIPSLFSKPGRHHDLGALHPPTQHNHSRYGARSALHPEATGAVGAPWLQFGRDLDVPHRFWQLPTVPSHGPVQVGGCAPVLFEACAETLETLRFYASDASVGE
jgi:hypothetical protein